MKANFLTASGIPPIAKYLLMYDIPCAKTCSSTSAVGVRDIYSELFGVVGGKVDPTKSAFPNGIPTVLPKLDVKNAKLSNK